MSNENDFSNSPGSSDEISRSPETATGETTDAIINQEIFFATTPTVNDEPPIEMGDVQPAEEVIDLVVVIEDQPRELDRRHQQTDDPIPYLPSPLDLYNANDDLATLSPGPQVIPFYANVDIPDHDVILTHRETVAVQHEDDDVHIEMAERAAAEPVESPGQHEFINNEIHNFPVQTTVEIDLTRDNDNDDSPGGDASPVIIDLTAEDEVVQVIDLTGDDDEREGTDPIQVPSPVVPFIERLAPVAVPSYEVADPNPIYSVTTDHAQQTIETTAQLQVPVLPTRKKKRSSSSDEIGHVHKKHLPGGVTLARYTIV